MNTKVSEKLWKEKKKKHKKFHQSNLQQTKIIVENKVKDMDRKMVECLSNMEDKIVDIEKKTLWRICDTEEIVK